MTGEVQEFWGDHRDHHRGERGWNVATVRPLLWLASIKGFTRDTMYPQDDGKQRYPQCSGFQPHIHTHIQCVCICARESFKGRGWRILNILPGVHQSLRTKNWFASFMILGFISWPWKWQAAVIKMRYLFSITDPKSREQMVFYGISDWRAWTWPEGFLHRKPLTDDESRGSTLGWWSAVLSQCCLQIMQTAPGIMVCWLLIGQLWVHVRNGIYFDSDSCQPWQAWGIWKAPVGIGSALRGDSILLLDHALGGLETHGPWHPRHLPWDLPLGVEKGLRNHAPFKMM